MIDVIDRSDDQEAEVNQPPFTGKQLADMGRIRWLKSILDPVYPLTIDQWQDALMRERNPRYQLAWWTGFAKVYRSMTVDLPPEKCKEVFDYLLRRDRGTTAPDPGE